MLGEANGDGFTKSALTPDGPAVEAADIYRVYFHGPAYQVVEQSVDGTERGSLDSVAKTCRLITIRLN